MTSYLNSYQEGPPFIQIDINDKCNLRCRTCERGLGLMKNTHRSMPIDLFRKIVQKAKNEGYYAIAFSNWTEPFLSRNFKEYVSAVKEQELFCIVSSNLSLEPANNFAVIREGLVAGADRLFISVSGYNQDIYEVNHLGGNVSWVRANLEQIAGLKQNKIIKTDIVLKFIRFDYNASEERTLSNYAKQLDVNFLMVEGSSHPKNAEAFAKDRTEDYYLNAMKNYIPTRKYEKNGELCYLIMRDLPIDCQGNVYLCCAAPNYPFFNFGSYLEMSFEDLLIRRFIHPYCHLCSMPRRQMTSSEAMMLVDGLKCKIGNVS
jgi:MoaA/NifB/PqqE/SkfB family radical SAM enzyme